MPATQSTSLLYVGPVSSFGVVKPTKGDAAPKSDDRPLITGETYDDLPMDHPVIGNLIRAKLLIPDSEAEASPKTAVSDSTNTKGGDASSDKKGGAK